MFCSLTQTNRIFDAQVHQFYEDATEEEIEGIKRRDFAGWLKFYVTDRQRKGESLPTWLVEVTHGLNTVATAYPRFCTRGYAFRVRDARRTRSTADYSISSKSGDVVYYGILNEILEVRYPGMLDLRCIVFMADWYEPLLGRGVRVDQNGVIAVNSRLRMRNYDPFILASQANQVCYISYPRVTYRTDPWITVTQIDPRGQIYGVPDHEALQPDRSFPILVEETGEDVELIADSTTVGDDVVDSESEEPLDEFDDEVDSLPSDYSSEESV